MRNEERGQGGNEPSCDVVGDGESYQVDVEEDRGRVVVMRMGRAGRLRCGADVDAVEEREETESDRGAGRDSVGSTGLILSERMKWLWSGMDMAPGTEG